MYQQTSDDRKLEESIASLQNISTVQREILYSTKYSDSDFEYRHVFMPQVLARMIPKQHLMSESEWRNLGVQQSRGWEHYMIHSPEPHILLFRRKYEALSIF